MAKNSENKGIPEKEAKAGNKKDLWGRKSRPKNTFDRGVKR